MNDDKSNPPASDPQASPEHGVADALNSFLRELTETIRKQPVFAVAACLIALVYPLALLASATFLFVNFGPTGWLFLVIVLAVVLGIMAPRLPRE